MTRWQHLCSAFRIPRSEIVIVTRPDELSDKKLTEILQAVPKEHLLYRAFMQLLEETREEAIANIAEDATSATAMAMHAGGAKYLAAVRDDILRRRALKKSSNT